MTIHDQIEELDRIADELRYAGAQAQRPAVSAGSVGIGQDVEVLADRLRALTADLPEAYRERVTALADRARMTSSGLQDYKGLRTPYARAYERLARDVSTLAAELTTR